MVNGPHVRTHFDSSGNLLVTMDDHGIYDYVKDLLTEKPNLGHLYVTHADGPPASYSITYSGNHAARVGEALAGVDAAELHRIFAVNSPRQGA